MNKNTTSFLFLEIILRILIQKWEYNERILSAFKYLLFLLTTEVRAQTKNSISILHELCQKNGWKQPVERVVQETGTPNDKTFEIRFLLQFK